jgi:acylglycerol lipase
VLSYKHWPATGGPWAHLLLVHGIAEHVGRHRHVAERLAAAGIEVHAYDVRGFGESEGRRAYVERWSVYHDDLERQLRAVRGRAGALPVVLYGHSMGGLIAAGYVLSERPRPEVLVLSAPAIAATVPLWKRAAAAVLASIAPTMEIANNIEPGSLAHDPAVEAAYRADPRAYHRTTARLGKELLDEQARVVRALAHVDALPIPTYVIQGSEDGIVPLRASAILGEKKNVTRRVYAGGRHELHNEADGPRTIDDTIAWVRATCAASSGSQAPRAMNR